MSGPPEPGVMSRPVPEAAPIVGVLLAFGFALFGFLFSADHLGTVLVTLLLLYPFVLFGIMQSDDPTAVFRPDAVLAAGFLVGAPVLVYGVATGRPLFGALVAAVAAVPPALYHAHYGDSVNPLSPVASLVAGLLAAGGLLAYGSGSGRPLLGALTAATVGLAAVAYHRERGARPPRRVRTAFVIVGLGGGLVAFGVLTVAGRPSAGLAVGAVLVAVGAALALDAER